MPPIYAYVVLYSFLTSLIYINVFYQLISDQVNMSTIFSANNIKDVVAQLFSMVP